MAVSEKSKANLVASHKGNKFASHDKPWTNALQRVLLQLECEIQGIDGKPRKVKAGEALREIAERTVMMALNGDRDARKEISDRLDGKPSEYLNINRTNDPTTLTDDELADIAARGRAGTDPAPASEEKPSSVH